MTDQVTEPREQRTPMALLPYQQRWCADRAQVKVIEKSRRIGLSWGEAADTALLAASASGMNAFYIGYMKDMAKEFIQDCAEFAKAYSLAAGEISESEEVWEDGNEQKAITIYTLRFASGHRIEALSSAPRNLRGKQGRVILDEAAFHNDLAELLKAALALLIWGGEVHIISTHNGAENAFNDTVQDIRAGKVPYSLHRVTFQDAIDDGLYERVCLRTGKPPSAEAKAAWIKGIRDSADSGQAHDRRRRPAAARRLWRGDFAGLCSESGGRRADPLWAFGWIVHTHKAKSGYLARGGLFRSLAWPYLFRNYSARDLAEFLEIHGLPLRLGKYPSTSSDVEKRTLLNAVINIGHAAAGIIPEGMMVEFQEAAKGSHDPFAWMIEWCERTVSKAVLGQNVGNDSARKGSLAGAEVDNDVRIDLLKSDARQLQSTLTRDLIFPMLALNRGVTDIKRCPQFVFEVVEPEDLKTYADALPKLVEGGLQIPVSWAHGKLNIPMPKDGEPVMTFTKAPVPVGLRAALSAQRQIDRNPAGTLADNLQGEGADPLRAWIDQIRTMVDQADSLEALRDALLSAYGDLDPAALAAVMQMGFAAAEAGGRFDVAVESDLIGQ